MDLSLQQDRCLNNDFFRLLTGSYQRLVGKLLVNAEHSVERAVHWLYDEATFCVLAHDTVADPHFIYANRAAQRCFGYSWDEFLTLPSRLSAEQPNRAERQRLLDAVTRQGFIADYTGWRISKTGRRFLIEDGTIWQLIDELGVIHGQAATFSRWREA